MTKIINGVLVPDDKRSGTSSNLADKEEGQISGGPSTSGSSAMTGSSLFSSDNTITICNRAIPRYAVGVFLFICLLMGGFQGLIGGGLVLGALYVVGSRLPNNNNNNNNNTSVANNRSIASNSKGMSRMPVGGGGNGANIKGFSDLPKSATPKGC